MNTFLIKSLFIIFSFKAFSSDLSIENKFIVFIGNPGVGKSTIINSIAKSVVTESGTSSSGLTKICQFFEKDGITYIDTPGLSDIKMRNQAIEEIENAFKMNGFYKIFFVLTLQAGRIKPEDIKTINQVMEAIKSEDKKFSIIINQVKRKEKEDSFDNEANFNLICEKINGCSNKTSNISYIECDRNIEDDLTEFITIDERLHNFLYQENYFYLTKDKVEKINTEDVEELKRKSEEEKKALEQKLLESKKQVNRVKTKINSYQRPKKKKWYKRIF